MRLDPEDPDQILRNERVLSFFMPKPLHNDIPAITAFPPKAVIRLSPEANNRYLCATAAQGGTKSSSL